MSICGVCFFTINEDEKRYECDSEKCDIYTCCECIETLINFSKGESVIPACPNSECKGIYILSNLKTLENEILLHYYRACFNHFNHYEGETVNKKIQQIQIINKIRDERHAFIKQNFPGGINMVADIAFKSKLSKMNKENAKFIKSQITGMKKKCPNLVCKGHLDNNMICILCDTEFCEMCEEKKIDRHKCKQEDLDTINLINNMIACPKCKIKVFKNEGCDSITCANCNTKFLYSTGKEGGHGSDNQKIKIDNDEVATLSILSDLIPDECQDLLIKFTSYEKKPVSKDIILTPLKTHIQEQSKKRTRTGKRIALRLNKYILSRNYYKKYSKLLIEFEEFIKNTKTAPEINIELQKLIDIMDGNIIFNE